MEPLGDRVAGFQMLPPICGSHSIQGGTCHTSESCSFMLGDHSPLHLSFEAGIVPTVCREHWLPLAECPWLTDILIHLHFWQNSCHGKHTACPQPHLHSYLVQLIFLETFLRGTYFFYLQRSLGSLDHPDRPLLHPSFLALQDFPCHS